MQFAFKLKHHFFNAFRELFVHHHGSLDFRAKLFALMISANEDPREQDYEIVENIGMKIYKNDKERAKLLMLSTKELVEKVKDDNGLDTDILIGNIQKELKLVPRYAKKIDIGSLKELLGTSHDRDTLSYQENILEFLEKLKDETLNEKMVEIEKEEEKVKSKY